MPLPAFNSDYVSLPDLEEKEGSLVSPAHAASGPIKPKRQGTPRARITEANARYLAFAGLFPCADSEAFSILSYRQENPFCPAGELTSVKGTEKRLQKLVKLGALEKHRHAISGAYLYGLTPLGQAYATAYGYDMEGATRMSGLSLERLSHYRYIAHIAAQFTSPADYFKDSLGIGAIPIENLVPERLMRLSYDTVKRELIAGKKLGQPADFGVRRKEALTTALQAIEQGSLEWEDLTLAYPILFTLGFPQRQGSTLKAVHQPDLAVVVPGRTDEHTENLLVEVELSKKSFGNYDSILATVKKELSKPFAYKRAVYFTQSKEVENLLKKVDKAGGYGLIDSGKLVILPVCDRDGVPIKAQRRVQAVGA